MSTIKFLGKSYVRPVAPTTATVVNNVHTCDFDDNNNFKVNLNNATSWIQLHSSDAAGHEGLAGTIVITNPSSVGSLSISIRVGSSGGSSIKTPGGSAISFNTSANVIHIVSYYVHASNKVLINYIGEFDSQG